MDVTLACDDDYIRVHKMVQISCSELFHTVSLNNRTLRLEKHIEMSKNFKTQNSDVKEEHFDNGLLKIMIFRIDEQNWKKRVVVVGKTAEHPDWRLEQK